MSAKAPSFWLDSELLQVLIETMQLHTVTKLKAEAGKIIDRALKGTPQYIVRKDGLVMIVRADLFAVEHHPEGYYADCYNDPKRMALEERAVKAVPFRPER